VTVWTAHELECDATDKPDATKGCYRKYEPPEGTPTYSVTPAQLRALAAKDGWTRVRTGARHRWDRDFCPAHKPQEAPRGE
jgi:hypothetical protein